MSELKVDIRVERPGFSFDVNESFPIGITGIFGHSGAGKSTLLHCISGIQTPAEGTVVCNGETFYSSRLKRNVPVFERHIGYVFQEGRLFPHLSVRKNLMYSTRAKGRTIQKHELTEVVEMLEIGALLDKYPSQLSGGERQRVALGRALLMKPVALLLDEPFSALDQNLRRQIVPYIVEVAEKIQVPVLVVSHDLSDLLKLSHRLCIMSNGRIKGHDDYKNLIKNESVFKYFPKSEVINVIDMKVIEKDTSNGMITLNGRGEGRKVKITFEPGISAYNNGSRVRVFLRPDDIVLAKEAVTGITFRNQLKGNIESITQDGPRVLCLIDCGFPLLAQVSCQAVKELELKTGSAVHCLFKSLALDSVPL